MSRNSPTFPHREFNHLLVYSHTIYPTLLIDTILDISIHLIAVCIINLSIYSAVILSHTTDLKGVNGTIIRIKKQTFLYNCYHHALSPYRALYDHEEYSDFFIPNIEVSYSKYLLIQKFIMV